MDYKKAIKDKGLKIVWLAEQIGCNYASLRVYINNPSIMPLEIEKNLKAKLKD